MQSYNDQYQQLICRLEDELHSSTKINSKLLNIIDDFVTVAFWNSQDKILWQQLYNPKHSAVPHTWTILDETVMLVDGLFGRLSAGIHVRNLGIFVLNLKDSAMYPGTATRWRFLCEKIKNKSHIFYVDETTSAIRQHDNYLLEMFSKTQINI